MDELVDPPPVVVGVEASTVGRDALDWAAAEAAARSSPLWLVHASMPRIDPGSLGLASYAAPQLDDGGVLEDAARRAQLVAPELEVVTCLVAGGPVPAILGQRAGLVVVGSRRHDGVRGGRSGSVAVALAAHARCPVVVVPPLRAVTPGPSRARVVVGVDGSDLSSAAIGFALGAAAQRGVGVTALHAWTPRQPADVGAVGAAGADEAATPDAERRAFDGALARWRQWFPLVEVTTKLVCDDPAQALVRESAGAALVAVGSRGRGRMTGALFGSVSQRVMRTAQCAVAVVRTQAVTARRFRVA
jgi:nucleotide-binding universal stress UspA family protein